ncbi:hypothetical protein AwDysgo_02400 [Bacteroidales bacterium]|nr:hypothetical protein AwDysgo_02400 [Bacteroidales bacterium]
MNAKTFDEVASKIKGIKFVEKFDLIVAIANGGIIPAAMINQILGIEIQLLKLSFRDDNQQMLYDSPLLIEDICFEYANKTILLVEDRVKTGATINLAYKLLSPKAKLVKTFTINGIADYSTYNETCFMFPWLVNI